MKSQGTLWLELTKHAVFRTRFNANDIEQMNHNHEHAKDAADHHQSPRHLVWALIFFSDGSQLGMGKYAKGNKR